MYKLLVQVMKKTCIIAVAMLLFLMTGSAQTTSVPRFTFGAEWGYIGIFYSGYHYNFYAPEGHRMDPRHHEFTYISNAEAYLHGGYNLNEKYNVSIYMGLSAIGEYHHTLPISVRLTRYYGEDPMKDRWLAFLDVGSGISIKEHPQKLLSGKVGIGYRLSLSRNTKLDFTAALRTVLTHPDIDYYGTPIPYERVNRNNAYISALSLGMAVTF